MAAVTAFGTLANTTHAGLTAYFRATGCTALTIADVLPLLSKITVYEDEYVIGEMKIWDTGTEAAEPNNCAMCRVMVYNDGWIVAWFDKETQNQQASGACTFIDAQTLGNFGSIITEYLDKHNGCFLKVTSSSPTDSECPDNTVFCIRETNFIDNRIKVHEDTSTNEYHFNTGHTYATEVYMTNGNLVWWGHASNIHGSPSNLSNRLYRAIYEMWENLRYSSNATTATDTAITKAFLDDGGLFTDYTTDFNDDGANDVELIPATEEINDAFYYGSSNKFRGLNLNIGTAGVGNTIVWEYWDGSAWSSLTVTDNTVGFTVLGENTITFTPYDDWAKCFVNSSEQYWIRSRVSVAAFTTQPLLTQGWIIVSDSLLYSNSNLGMYSFEDTSALYCLICGVSAYAQDTNNDTYFYNTSMLGKIIYSHSISCGGYINSTSYTTGYIQFNGVLYLSVNILKNYPPETNGYHIFNIEDIDHPVGVQNSFRCYAVSIKSAYKIYMTLASVLITS
jgi:hypothetical protein